jgi:hypothetical protein
LIPILKEDIFFTWLASTKLLNLAHEVQFLFCTISFRGFCETRQKVEELKAMREAYTNELQRLKANFLFLFFCFVKYEYCTFLSDVSSPIQMALMPSVSILPSDPNKSASAILVFAEPNIPKNI